MGPYEIVAPVGAGGMGEVYKARDTRLDRTVAIKVSNDPFSERFQREARAIAALNHSNICQLYDVGPNYLVMEFVEGAPVAPVDNARKLLDMAMQIADGLTAAHAAGIVHRDLKPHNILATREGRVKILDFGLAKTAVSTQSAAGATQTLGITDPGTTIGTIDYMSPEQARGDPNLTPQSDQFSFGLVLYELASGKRAFHRASAPETMTAIIREDADPLPASVPAPLRWVIERLLAKDPTERYDSTRDLYRELKQIRDRLSQSAAVVQVAAPEARNRKLGQLVALAVFVAIAASIATAYMGLAPDVDLSTYKFTPLAPGGIDERESAWSPDGKSIAYEARVHGIYQIFTRGVGSPDAAQLTSASTSASGPFWSPDGQFIYYSSGHNLWSIPAAGGTARRVLENAEAASLHPDGKTLAFTWGGKVWITSLNGGQPKEFWPGPISRFQQLNVPRFAPDGSALAAFANGLWILPYPTGKPRKLPTTNPQFRGAAWFPDSRTLLVAEAGTFEEGALIRVGVRDGRRRTIYSGPSNLWLPSVSPDGRRIAFSSGSAEWDVVEVGFSGGTVHTMVEGVGTNWYPDWAPSGTHFLFTANSVAGLAIVDRDASGSGFTRRLMESGDTARWSPDGARFVYVDRASPDKLMLVNVSGGRSVVLDQVASVWGEAWSPDGQWICYLRREGVATKLAKIRATPGAAPVILADAEIWSRLLPQWSPLGDWILYPAAGGLDLISPDGKSQRKLTTRQLLACNFSRDGSQVYGIFHNTTGEGAEWQLYAVNVKAGTEKLLTPVDFPPATGMLAGFSIHPDGKRALTSISKVSDQIWMLEGFERRQNWFARLVGRP